MELLDIKYKFLITVFIAGIPVYFGNALLNHGTNNFYTGMFVSLLMLDVGLIVLFYKLMIEKRQQTALQIWLTMWNIGAIGFSFSYLLTHLPNGL